MRRVRRRRGRQRVMWPRVSKVRGLAECDVFKLMSVVAFFSLYLCRVLNEAVERSAELTR